MKKPIIICSVVLLLAATWTFAASPSGQPFDALNNAILAIQTQINSLQNQINNIQLTPGPKGDKGDKGDTGSPSWDEARIAALESRVLALENPTPVPLLPGTRLWSNFHPTTDKTEGTYIDVSNASSVVLHFDWQGPSGHACQYAYSNSDDGVNTSFYSTFLYFDEGGCQATATIPVTSDFIKIDAWTPPSGTLNASLELIYTCIGAVCDNFNSYTDGSIAGQGSWTNRINGEAFFVEGTTIHEGSKALHNTYNDGDSIITKSGSIPRYDGKQSIYVRTENRSNWGAYATGENFQVRLSNGSWDGPFRIDVSFFKDGHVAYNGTVHPWETFGSYNDNEWNLLDIEWRSSDRTARYRINHGPWTDWDTFNGASSFNGVDNIGLEIIHLGTGGIYIDDIH
jgi:hypothetical protein